MAAYVIFYSFLLFLIRLLQFSLASYQSPTIRKEVRHIIENEPESILPLVHPYIYQFLADLPLTPGEYKIGCQHAPFQGHAIRLKNGGITAFLGVGARIDSVREPGCFACGESHVHFKTRAMIVIDEESTGSCTYSDTETESEEQEVLEPPTFRGTFGGPYLKELPNCVII